MRRCGASVIPILDRKTTRSTSRGFLLDGRTLRRARGSASRFSEPENLLANSLTSVC